MYILQETLFSFEEWLKIESGNRLGLFYGRYWLKYVCNPPKLRGMERKKKRLGFSPSLF